LLLLLMNWYLSLPDEAVGAHKRKKKIQERAADKRFLLEKYQFYIFTRLECHALSLTSRILSQLEANREVF